jgi:hypothetical protein
VDYEQLQVKKFGACVPVTAERLLDAGLPLPPGMEPPEPYVPTRLSWRTRWRLARAERLYNLRRRVGFRIANCDPDDEDW